MPKGEGGIFQPSAAKWNILGTNDAHFYTYAGEGTNAIQQVKMTTYSNVASAATSIPTDDTIPQNTEGTEYMSQAITPMSATNLLIIEVGMLIASSVTSNMVLALFQDSTANALAVANQYQQTATGMCQVPLSYSMTAGTTSSTTFKLRAGTGGTTTMNGTGAARYFGAIPKSWIKVTEYKV